MTEDIFQRRQETAREIIPRQHHRENDVEERSDEKEPFGVEAVEGRARALVSGHKARRRR